METPTTRPARPRASDPTGEGRVGRYVLERRLGAGGMGIVYLARDPQLDRRVALKVLRADQSGDTKARGRVAREAKAMARVSHRNVVGVYDAGVFEDADGESRIFIAMELVEGRDLRAWMRALRETARWKRGEATGEILDRFLEAGEGLAVAHEAGLVHRDFKPANVLVDDDGHARVGDFGLARPLEERDAEAMATQLVESDISLELTRTEDLVGTPGYMAPELLRPQPADALSDQYAFCVSLYEALYGERPIHAETFPALALATLQGNVRPPPAEPPVPARLRKILLRGLSVEPEARWPSMRALLEALRRERLRPQRRRRAL
ncbi:MAG TPA: serine/threonine-protein kinase, partial [Polyangiaceae bacterium LLY-WYZ-15_(1-7)]|nr:serine/threonine-protein kinase [Polyangiaceae bacterium LLY-WYZ-15_(1-7)]